MTHFIDKRMVYFSKAVHYGGVRAAADALNIAPSAVSRQIVSLENQLGTQLLERHIKGAIPTEAGKELLMCYKELLNQECILKEKIAALKGLDAGNIEISTGAGYVRYISKVVTVFSATHPNIKIRINVSSSNEILRKILDNESHIGIIYNPVNHKHIRTHFEMNHRLSVFLNKIHPLAQHNQITLHDIRNHRLALTDTTYGIRQLIEEAERSQNIALAPTLVCNDLNLLKDYARDGGITLLPEFMYYSDDADTLLIKPFINQNIESTKTQIISRHGKPLSKAVAKLISQITVVFDNLDKTFQKINQ